MGIIMIGGALSISSWWYKKGGVSRVVSSPFQGKFEPLRAHCFSPSRYQQHWLLCHMELYSSEFEFPRAID